MSDPPQPPPGADTALFSQDVLAVAVKTRLAELARFPVLDGAGRRVGEVAWDGARELDGLTPRRRERLSVDARLPQTLVVRDAGGVRLRLTRPRVGWDRVLLRVSRPDGSELGVVLGSWWRRRYQLESGGTRVGTIRREGTSDSPRVTYTVTDAAAAEVARIQRVPTPEGPRFVTELRRPLPEPLAGLVLAAALTADTALSTYGRLG